MSIVTKSIVNADAEALVNSTGSKALSPRVKSACASLKP
jgi:hypothetical protein